MLLREEGDAVIAIGQPSHTWISGQLARTWGNERLPARAPRGGLLGRRRSARPARTPVLAQGFTTSRHVSNVEAGRTNRTLAQLAAIVDGLSASSTSTCAA